MKPKLSIHSPNQKLPPHLVRKMIRAIVAVLAADMLAQAQTNLIVNGSFESPAEATYQTLFAGATNLAPWVINSNSVDVANINNGYTSGTAYDGVQYVDLDGGPGPGQISQTFATTAGRNYFLSFAYANNYVNQSSAGMRVRIYDTNGTVFGPITVTHASSAANILNWYFYTNSFTGTGRSNTVEFTSSSAAGSFGGMFLDAVAIATNPPVLTAAQAMQPGDVVVANANLGQLVRIRPDGTQIPFGPYLGAIYGMAFDASNTLFVAHGQISKISPLGEAVNFTAAVGSPIALAFDAAGDFFVTYEGVGIEQLPLNGIGGVTNITDGPFTQCAGLVVDAAGNRFTSEAAANKLWKFPAGAVEGTVIDTNLTTPGGMALDLAGNIYLSDFGSTNIYKYWPDGTHRTTFASGFSLPAGLAFDNNGCLYEVDYGSGQVFKISPDGKQRSIFASGLHLAGFIAVARGPVPVILSAAQESGENFSFSFQTVTNQSYTIQQNTNLLSANWLNYTNITGNGSVYQFTAPLGVKTKNFFRVAQP